MAGSTACHSNRGVSVLRDMLLVLLWFVVFSVLAAQAHVRDGVAFYFDVEVHRAIRKMFPDPWLQGVPLPPSVLLLAC